MAHTTLRQRVIGNPGTRRRNRSRNPGEILSFVLPAGNPGRKRGNMAKARRKNRGRSAKSNPGHRKHHHHRKMNASHHRHHRRRSNPGIRHHRRRRNPGFGGEIGNMFTNAVFVIVGAIGSKLGAQAFLGTNNVGLVGYGGNALVGGVLWFLADKVMHNKSAANGIVAGTLVQIILRIINDYTPFGSYVANLGMGDYQAQSFVTPQVLVDPWRSAQIQVPNGWGPAAAPIPVAGAGATQMGPKALPSMTKAAAATAAGGAGMTGYGTQALYGSGMNSLY